MPRTRAKKKAKSKTAPHRAARASWSGLLRFGLVSFGVEAINAHSAAGSTVSFHQLHDKCHSRIRYQKVCPIHGPVENDEIVKGYEFQKGEYVEVDPEELDELQTEKERALTIDAFIAPATIDPIYFDGRMYYLAPRGEEARQPYSVFLEALARKDRYAVGQVVFSGREQLVLLRPIEGALHMAMLNYAPEIRAAAPTVGELSKVPAADKTLKLAEKLIESWEEDEFDIAAYVDHYREKVKELIDAKVEGREIVTPEVEDEPEVINLMDALKKSVERGRGERSGAAKRPRRKSPSVKTRKRRSRRTA